ncbi:MAG: MarR family transcriptional regulator [Planctomycetota bacterium]|nr:MarR family transcriptional regulator [Planctomycetota bacterium]
MTDLPLDSPKRRRLPPLLRHAWYGLNQAFRRRIASIGLTPDQFTTLRLLCECANGLTQRELALKMGSDPNTVSALVQRMESSGLLERLTHETDRRARRIRVTAQGRKAYKKARPLALNLQAEILGVLPEAERDTFLDALQKISEACQRAAEQDTGRVLAQPLADEDGEDGKPEDA